MDYELMNTGSEMSIPVLAAHCLLELDHSRRGEPCTEIYSIELLRLATMQDNLEARAAVQHCFGGMVRDWFRRHPSREMACCFESEEHYIARAFEHFWQTTATHQRVEFSRLSAAVLYLRASLHGAIMDTLRAHALPMGISKPAPGEPRVEDNTDSGEAWNILKAKVSSSLEQRLAYLLFYCGLKPGEIALFCQQEFSDVQEIYHLRYNIMEQLLCNVGT